jgi:hypothetical protein
MNSVIVAAILLFLFVVYVTSKGQLPAYLTILGLGSASSSTTTGTAAPLGGVAGPLSQGTGITSIPTLPSLGPQPSFATGLPSLAAGVVTGTGAMDTAGNLADLAGLL